jgi:hypothetical protein
LLLVSPANVGRLLEKSRFHVLCIAALCESRAESREALNTLEQSVAAPSIVTRLPITCGCSDGRAMILIVAATAHRTLLLWAVFFGQQRMVGEEQNMTEPVKRRGGFRRCLLTAAGAALVAAAATTWANWFRGPDLTGDQAAQQIIAAARNGLNPVPLAFFARNVCVVPWGGLIEPASRRLFPSGKNFSFESQASDGIWWLVVGSETNESVTALAIDQAVLRWEPAKGIPVRELYQCPSAVRLDVSNVPTVVEFIE